MSDARHAARGILANCLMLIGGFLLTFFLSPFVVGSLGATRYGVWVVLGTLTSYITLLDLGLRGAVTQLVARAHASGDHGTSSTTVSTALWLRQWISLAVMAFAVVAALFVHRVLTVPPEYAAEARYVVIINGFTVILFLLGGVFGAVLAAMNRQDILAATLVLQAVVRAAGTIVALRAGYSLVALAAVDSAATLMAQGLMMYRCFREYPELRVSLGVPSRASVATLAGYGGGLVLLQVFGHVSAFGPLLVIGALLPPAAAAYYSIGNSLIENVRHVLTGISPVFLPLASRYHATGDELRLQALMQRGTRLVLVVTLPILLGLFFRGETFIGVWMGSEYAKQAGEILRILCIPAIVAAANSTAINVVFGLGKQRDFIPWLGIQALTTVALCAAVAGYGLSAVAWAVAIPAVLVGLFCWTGNVCRLIGLPVGTYVIGSWVRPALAAVPFAVACAVTDSNWHASSTLRVLWQIAALLPIYGISCAVILWRDLTQGWRIIRARPTLSEASASALS